LIVDDWAFAAPAQFLRGQLMNPDDHSEFGIANLKSISPKKVKLGQEALITTGYLETCEGFPLVIQPNGENLDLVTWAASNRSFIETELLKHGAVYFHKFHVDSVSQFENFARVLSPDLLDYHERAAPRVEVGNNIYTSTEYPADQPIPLHHEMSYSHNWPTKLWFCCLQPAQQGGRTPIADDRKIFNLIPPLIKEQFIRKKVMYLRNYGMGVDLPWQEVFRTTDRSVVEEYCRRARTEFEWMDRDRLRTRQVRQAVATHPRTGDTVWFNHAHMFHVSNLEPATRKSLQEEFEDDELPRNAFYGDGSPIEDSILAEIREIYQRHSVAFTWRAGDIMLVDNFLASHGREPFSGPRKVLVAMAELYTNQDILA
jgi:alpha-ketoglutarate-dependent taurine dioxygenase